MSSTYSNSLRVELIGSGDQAGAWGSTTNNNFAYIFDSAIAGYVSVDITTAPYTLTSIDGPTSSSALNQSVYASLRFYNAVGASTVYAPAVSKTYIIWNDTSYAVTLYNTGYSTGPTIAAGARVLVFSTGTAFYEVSAQTINGVVPIAKGGTGQTTANAAFNALAPVQTSANGRYLKSDGTNTSWDAIDVGSADISGVLLGANGGTGVANSGKTITLGGNLTTSGAFATTLTATNTTSVTLPTAGTLATLAGSETLTNKTLTSPTLTTPILGTPASGTLTSCTGLPLTTGVTGTLPVANGGTGVTGSTGSGSVVLSTSPSLTTPILGTPQSGNFSTGTFTWPTFNQNTTGNAATANNATTAGGLTPSATAGVASRIVAADASGYIYNNYFSSTDNSQTGSVSAVMVKAGDNFLRSGTAAAVATFISGQSMNIAGNAAGLSSTLAIASGGTGTTGFTAGYIHYGAFSTSANLTYDGTDFTCGGNVTAYSDERFKTNWRDLPADFVEQLAKVKHGVYDRTDQDITQVGVSAQSLQPIMEHAVIANDEGKLSVAYGNAALVAAIKLAERVVALEAKIAELTKE
jgi:hypothetical protein